MKEELYEALLSLVTHFTMFPDIPRFCHPFSRIPPSAYHELIELGYVERVRTAHDFDTVTLEGQKVRHPLFKRMAEANRQFIEANPSELVEADGKRWLVGYTPTAAGMQLCAERDADRIQQAVNRVRAVVGDEPLKTVTEMVSQLAGRL